MASAAPGESSPITLDEVNDAIRAILRGAQRVRQRDGTEYTKADLGLLYQMRRDLVADAQLHELDAGGAYLPAAFREPH